MTLKLCDQTFLKKISGYHCQVETVILWPSAKIIIVHNTYFLNNVGSQAQGTKLTFLARSRLAPKFSKVVAKAIKLGAIKKKKDS